MAVDTNTYYNNYDSSSVLPSYLANEINEVLDTECDNLADNTGTSGQDDSNCDVLNNELIPAIQQVYYQIKNGMMNIYANEDSKCEDDNSPTIASILSRLLRFDEAVSCILCTYDPRLIAYLKSGTYPQVLMGGGTSSTYPVWQNPSTSPTTGSSLPITSGAVYTAIQNAVLSVFHKATDDAAWVAAGGQFTYDYYAEVPAALIYQDMTEVETNDIAMIKNGADGTNQEYVYDGTTWEPMDVIGEPSNFAVIEIEKGYFKDDEIYWMKDTAGNITWNIMDISVTELENRVTALETIYGDAVLSYDSTNYLFGVADTYAQAQAVPSTAGKTTITLVMGA